MIAGLGVYLRSGDVTASLWPSPGSLPRPPPLSVFPSGPSTTDAGCHFGTSGTALLAAYAVGELGRTCSLPSGQKAQSGGDRGSDSSQSLSSLVGSLGSLPGYTPPTGPEHPARLDQLELHRLSVQARLVRVPASCSSMLIERGRVHGCGRLDYEYSPTSRTPSDPLRPDVVPPLDQRLHRHRGRAVLPVVDLQPVPLPRPSQISLHSNPVVGIPYQGLDVADGVRHLHLTGTKYFLANSPQVEQLGADSELTEVASMPASANVIEEDPRDDRGREERPLGARAS